MSKGLRQKKLRLGRGQGGGPWPLVGGGVCYLPGVWRATMPAGEVGLERSGHTKEAGPGPGATCL